MADGSGECSLVRVFGLDGALPAASTPEDSSWPGSLDKERGRICRKAADYMLPTESVTRLGAPRHGASDARRRGPPSARVVLDTNIVLDWLVFGDASAAAVGAAIQSGRLEWLTTPRMLAELRAVLAKPLAARWEPCRELALTIDVAALAAICPDPAVDRLLVCRDATDQVFIDLARAHSPAVLLTRDRALLALRRRAAVFAIDISTAAGWPGAATL